MSEGEFDLSRGVPTRRLRGGIHLRKRLQAQAVELQSEGKTIGAAVSGNTLLTAEIQTAKLTHLVDCNN
jgi:hypothetical protein